MISVAERQERLDAVADVIGTQRAEGIHPGPALLAIMQRYAEGELTLEQMSEEMDSCAKAPAALASVA